MKLIVDSARPSHFGLYTADNNIDFFLLRLPPLFSCQDELRTFLPRLLGRVRALFFHIVMWRDVFLPHTDIYPTTTYS